MTYLKFDLRLFLTLIIAFIFMTVLGTLTHELGHYSTARLLGYHATINYGSSHYWDKETNDFFMETYKLYSNEIENDLDFPLRKKYKEAINKSRTDAFWIILGGPLQTMITGTFGIFLLFFYRKRIIVSEKVTVLGWAIIFLALFWLRELFNLFMAMVIFFWKGQLPTHGDEVRLTTYLEINIWTIQIITGVLGLGVLILVLKMIPKAQLLTFLLSGLIGGTLGFYIWLIKFGPIIMP